MIPASLYSLFYNLFVLLFTIILSSRYAYFQNDRLVQSEEKSSYWTLFIPLLLILFIGYRPLSGRYFVDMINYEENYRAFYFGSDYEWNWDTENYIFDNIFGLLGRYRFDIRVFFVGCAVVYFGAVYFAILREFRGNSLYAFICFLGAFSTYSYATNGLKAGVAASVFILAIAFLHKPLIAVVLLWISLGLHHSMILPIVAVVCAFFYRNSRTYLLFWILCLFIAALHITVFQEFIADRFDEGENSYLNSFDQDWGGKTGFRWDFILYSVVPILTGFIWYVKRGIKDVTYSVLYNTYVLSNAVWMLCMYANFTNRIAYLSWFLYPFVLVYPLFNFELYQSQSKILNWTIWGQLLFTLGMVYVYY